jgi:hypothetical protein
MRRAPGHQAAASKRERSLLSRTSGSAQTRQPSAIAAKFGPETRRGRVG